MKTRLQLIDAFCSGPFTGNPAAVCLLQTEADAGWMQQVAMEMNQAETAFLRRQDDGYELRWFTPTVEIDLCGHAMLAAAHFLFSEGFEDGPIRFHTRSGVLAADRSGDDIALNFPAEPPTGATLPHALEFLKSPVLWTGANRMDWFIRIDSAEGVRNLTPNFEEISSLGLRGLVVTAKESPEGRPGCDFVSRCFFPQSGVAEDHATGSAHCGLAVYWAAELGVNNLVGYQASPRGAILKLQMRGDRVNLLGRAVTTLSGELIT